MTGSHCNYILNLGRCVYADKFSVNYKVQVQLLQQGYAIPPMIIRPFIENAIIHGLRNKSGNTGVLNLSASIRNGYIIVQVEDNGTGRKMSIFNNLNQDKKANIEIQDLQIGTRVTIKLPLSNHS